MRLLLITTLSFVLSLSFLAPAVRASAGSPIVIASIQTGGTGSGNASQEVVILTNRTDEEVNVSKWCLRYSSATDVTSQTLTCLIPPVGFDLAVEPRGSILLLSTTHPLHTTADATFSGTLAAAGGHLRLIDAEGKELDKVGYGTATNPETSTAVAPAAGALLQRLAIDGVLQDTGNNAADFAVATAAMLLGGGIFEKPLPLDVCTNIDGLQELLPDGYVEDESGLCVVDVCENIADIQLTVPEGYESESKSCSIIPLRDDRLKITELLANPLGADEGSEFIELFNPNDYDVDLEGYILQTGVSFDRAVRIDTSITIPAGTFISLRAQDIPFILINSSSNVRLITPAGNVAAEAQPYNQLKEGIAWGELDGVWQSVLPTPGNPNMALIEPVEDEDDEQEEAVLTACPPGKYRNPATNRCRSIEQEVAALVPCGLGQERNPATGRCRGILAASTSLVPCGPGQERNPVTNRCRSIAAAATTALKPCAVGQERNPETNRCRKKAEAPGIASSVTSVSNTPEVSAATSQLQWWVIGLMTAATFGYGLFEWRYELAAGLKKFRRSQ